MDNANNSSIILGLNKQDQIKALREVGFTDLADNATWSEIVAHMRWAGGLRDLQIATYLKSSLRDSSPQRFYFSEEQWQAMSVNEKSKYIAYGVAVRAERMAFDSNANLVLIYMKNRDFLLKTYRYRPCIYNTYGAAPELVTTIL